MTDSDPANVPASGRLRTSEWPVATGGPELVSLVLLHSPYLGVKQLRSSSVAQPTRNTGARMTAPTPELAAAECQLVLVSVMTTLWRYCAPGVSWLIVKPRLWAPGFAGVRVGARLS